MQVRSDSNRFPNAFHFVTRQVIHRYDVSGSQRGNEMLPHPCQKDATAEQTINSRTINSRTINSQWCGETSDM
jgi:hypothetical protein